MRLPQYRKSFGIEHVHSLVEALAEGQPPVCAEASLLRRWYVKFHPDSGPLRIGTADELEELLGHELRLRYAGLIALHSVLSRGPELVSMDRQVLRTWL